MIRKSQWKFVATIMSILLFIFGVIYFGIHGFTENSVAKMASSNIENIVDTYKPFPNNPASSDIQPNGLIFFIEDKTLVCDTLAFSEDEINALYEKLNDDIPLSSIEKEGNVFYSIRQISGQKALIATSMRNYVKVINETRHNLLFAMILIYLILFLVVYLISFKVFAPIKNALEKQKQFISDASHELKTPITIISASTDVITGENNSQWVSNIKTQTDRLTTLVSDMLTLAKMDEKQVPLKIETFNLSNEILDTILPFEALAFEKNKNLIINVDKDVELTGDKQSIKKITSILIDNAIKHASVGGEIVINLKKENKQITFSVYNTGSTIKEENANKIFERFYRSDESRSRESGGSGLGLAIAKSICEVNKWKISAKSKLNEFMTITVLITDNKKR